MIIVTGGSGFIGSAVLRALNDRGISDILVVDNLGTDGKFKNLRAKQFHGIARPKEFLDALETGAVRPDTIIHMGACSTTTELDADFLLDNNAVTTRRLAVVARERGIRFIYASSASVYGDGALGFSDDDSLTPRLEPLNAYGFSKWLGDIFALRDGWSKRHVGLRFFNVFGPNEYHKGGQKSVIAHAYRKIAETGKMQLFESHKEGYGHGEQARDFIYVKDAVAVILWFLDHPDTSGIYNLGTGRARTFNDLARSIFAALDLDAEIEYIPTPETIRNAYQYFTEADVSKLRDAGCDHAFDALENTVKDYVQNYLVPGEKNL
jgi:ADP-L-glycero-D-manno-heptose 6-epimerase